MIIEGQITDVLNGTIFPGKITVENGIIQHIEKLASAPKQYILPGFIDAHVHIESSMLVPSEFARLAVVHGTVGTISDPHEIANVNGIEGVEFMLDNASKVPFKFYFGAPSCVPATTFETAGAVLDAKAVESLLQKEEITYLSEMMNYPGVLFKDPEVMAKIAAAHRLNKPVDGHAPGLRGKDMLEYVSAGISTDHECFTLEEAQEKLEAGMKILIREGSAAKNFEALIPLLADNPDKMMFCSDDKHPDSLLEGHINVLCKRAVSKGIPVMHVLKAACVNPVLHYKMKVGLLQINDLADFIVVNDLEGFEVIQTYINGQLVANEGKSHIESVAVSPVNQFDCEPIQESDIEILWNDYPSLDENTALKPVIEALEGQLITHALSCPASDFIVNEGKISSNPDTDTLKIVVVNRYKKAPVAKSFIRNFGLKSGAIASSVAHDSHNVIAVGVSDADIVKAVNLIIEAKGGVSVVGKDFDGVLPLPVAGLMSAEDGYQVAEAYTTIDTLAKSLGSPLAAPFMTLSFMALLVIPYLKLSDKGLFDGGKFRLM